MNDKMIEITEKAVRKDKEVSMADLLNQELTELQKAMIEEMAKVIDDRLIEANNYLGSMNKGKGYWIAQKLVEHYQPKIPKSSVVVDKEYLKKELQELEVQARKETAKKILKELITVIHDNTKYGGNFVVLYLKDLQEIAKQFGVEVEE